VDNLITIILDLLGTASIQAIFIILGVGFVSLGLGLKTPWGQISDKKLRWASLAFGGIFVIAGLLCVFVPGTKCESLLAPKETPVVTETVVPTEEDETTTETPAPTVDVEGLSDGAQFLILDYFGGLNDEVQTEDDLTYYWGLLKNEAQKSGYNNDFDEYQAFWWERRVKFKIYECSITEFVVDLKYFDRTDTDSKTSTGQVTDLKYTLERKNEEIKIDDIEDISSEGHYCDLVYEN
jgi:hypothetical protein